MTSLPPPECSRCLHSSASSSEACFCSSLWSIEPIDGAGEGLVAQCNLDTGQLVLSDPTALIVALDPSFQPESSSSSSPSHSLQTAPNAAAASICLAFRLSPLLLASIDPAASLKTKRLGELVRRLHFEPMSQLRQRDEPCADFISLAAVKAAEAMAGPTDTAAALALRTTLMLRLLSAVKLNSFLSRDASSGAESMVLLLFVASVNHSCAPNCALRGSELRCSRPVRKGEQLCISYLNFSELRWSRSARRTKLFRSWGFQCQCSRCITTEESEAVSVKPAMELLELPVD